MLDLDPIKARRDAADDSKRPLKLHVGCKNPYACKVCMDYNAARLLWEADLMHLQANCRHDIAALIEEVERVRAENAELKSFEATRQVEYCKPLPFPTLCDHIDEPCDC